MPAGKRGGSLKGAKPRPKAAAKTGARSSGAKRARAVAYAPSKLNAAQSGLRIPPMLAAGVAFVVLGGGVVVALTTGDRMAMIGAAVDRQAASAGFRVAKVHVQGASELARRDILAASGVEAGSPILGIDLAAVRARVQTVGWIKQVKVVRLLPDTLVIAVAQRPPLAVWQSGRRLRVVDEDGHVITEADPTDFPDLPLVVGEGANELAGQILPMVKARPRLMARMEALVRVDNRRWDVRLKDGGLVQLPAIDEEPALIQLDRLDQDRRILDLGLSRIDLRQPSMVAFRPGEHTVAAVESPAGV